MDYQGGQVIDADFSSKDDDKKEGGGEESTLSLEPIPESVSEPESIGGSFEQVETSVPVTEAKSSRMLVLLALLLGGLGGLVSVSSLWQVRQIQSAVGQLQTVDTDAFEERLTTAQTELQRKLQGLEGRLERQAQERSAQIQALQTTQGHLQQQLGGVNESSSRDWQLPEADYLVRMAILRLNTIADVKGGRALLGEAYRILQEQDDPAAFQVRRQLMGAMERLQTLPLIERERLFLSLGALSDEVVGLPVSGHQFEGQPVKPEADREAGWSNWLDKLSPYVRVDFDADGTVQPVLAGQNLAQWHLALRLSMEQAQWAVLNGQQAVYAQSLDQVRQLLESRLDRQGPLVRGVLDRLTVLSRESVEQTLPDMQSALQALQDYMRSRQRVQPSAEAVSEADKEGHSS